MKNKLTLVHVELREANAFIEQHHRHHKPVVGHRFSVGVEHNGKLVGVAVVGRPVARALDQKNLLEVTRLCTDGTRNVCSFLYAACARSGKALGYYGIQSYILSTELGTSLKAAGWKFSHDTAGGDWNHSKSRKGKRRTDQPMIPKHCYNLMWKVDVHA